LESEVKEVLTTHIFSDDLVGGCESVTVIQFYTLGEGGKFQWETPRLDVAASGTIVDAVKEGWPRD